MTSSVDTDGRAVDVHGWIEIARLDDIPRAGARVVRAVHGDIALFRTQDDRVYALRDRCPHRGGPLSQGIVYGCRVACPLHGWSVELDTGHAVAPDKGETERFAVRIERDTVYLRVDPVTT